MMARAVGVIALMAVMVVSIMMMLVVMVLLMLVLMPVVVSSSSARETFSIAERMVLPSSWSQGVVRMAASAFFSRSSATAASNFS